MKPDASLPVLAYVGVGANLGEAYTQVQQAILQLADLPQTLLIAQSPLFRTAPIDAVGEDYINAVVSLHTSLSASALLQQLQEIEHGFGRQRLYYHAPRTLDLDILLYGQQQISTPTLTVPHRHMTQRAFVLIPLLQIDPTITIPGKGQAKDYLAQVANQRIEELN